MVKQVEIISKEMVKPSSPTPLHLRNHKLSFLDQIAPPVYVPLILFYQLQSGSETDLARESDRLRQSLSEVLIHYYPLAGRIKDNTTIDCSDEGVEFVEAHVRANMFDVIEDPEMEELKEYLPLDPYGVEISMARDLVLAIQVNFFECGGLAIGVCISHTIADGSSLVNFVNAWAAKSRGATNIVNPKFDLACQFPPQDLLGYAPSKGTAMKNLVTRRFIFDKKMLASLKEIASGSEVNHPTRVEALSAFLWRQFMEVAVIRSFKGNLFAAIHAVNLRTRMDPPLQDNAIGNIWRIAVAILSTSTDEKGYNDLAVKLRGTIKKIDNEYVKKLQSGEGILEYLRGVAQSHNSGVIEYCSFSSWNRFPIYEVDFGWGKPTWACTTTMPYKNVAIFTSTSCGEGIEAWINMLEEDMVVLQQLIRSSSHLVPPKSELKA